jgi:hypothetical protein
MFKNCMNCINQAPLSGTRSVHSSHSWSHCVPYQYLLQHRFRIPISSKESKSSMTSKLTYLNFKTQCQDTAVLPSQIMARLVPSKIPAPLWSATQFSTILVLAFCDLSTILVLAFNYAMGLTITPWANMTVAGETVLIVEIDFPVVIMSSRT